MKLLRISDIPANLKQIIDRVQKGETYVLLRYGKPVAMLVPYKEDDDGKATLSK